MARLVRVMAPVVLLCGEPFLKKAKLVADDQSRPACPALPVERERDVMVDTFDQMVANALLQQEIREKINALSPQQRDVLERVVAPTTA